MSIVFFSPDIRRRCPEISGIFRAALALTLYYGNTDKKDRFCRSAELVLKTRQLIALACFLIIFGLSHTAAFADDTTAAPKESAFLRMAEGQRYWFVFGAVTTIAHLTALSDKAKGDCIGNWYLPHKDAKQKLIEETLANHPGELPTTIILSLLTQACGPLAPAKN